MCDNPGASFSDELHLFFSDKLISNKWKPHPMNPIISDTRNSRPAGKIFKKNGRIYRPSQNSSKRYGYGFNINEITRLSETDYIEIRRGNVLPKWSKNLLGTHSFSNDKDLTFIDVKVRRSRLL